MSGHAATKGGMVGEQVGEAIHRNIDEVRDHEATIEVGMEDTIIGGIGRGAILVNPTAIRALLKRGDILQAMNQEDDFLQIASFDQHIDRMHKTMHY